MTPTTTLKVPAFLLEALRCPGRPDVPLCLEGDAFVCEVDGARRSFPVLDGTPLLIDEARSVFRFADFEGGGVTTMDIRDASVRLGSPSARLKNWVMGAIPDKSRTVSDFPAAAALAEILAADPRARILVVGAGDARFDAGSDARVVYSDVALAPDTQMIADAHDLPFADASFDAVFAVAVLEHVADPFRCVAEFQRVLAPDGLVYSATPFLQQVHMGAYDFTRFTALGHRRLFRAFDELRAGVSNGPGMVVTWSLQYFLTSFSESGNARSALLILSRFLAWPFLLADGFLARKAGAYDCSSGYYFYGRLRATPLHDREIVATYRGLVGSK